MDHGCDRCGGGGDEGALVIRVCVCVVLVTGCRGGRVGVGGGGCDVLRTSTDRIHTRRGSTS